MITKYDAFISYRHLPHDKAIVEKLQYLLEHYRPPRGVECTNTKRIQRVFVDQTELPTSGDLAADIKSALENSEFLIVICSEETKRSVWCMQEIDYFKELHNGETNKILTLLVSGEPREVFPEALCFETVDITLENGDVVKQRREIEPLAANVVAENTKKSIRKLKTEFLRIVAPILGCSYDDLYQRHHRRLIKTIAMAAVVVMLIVISFSLYVMNNAAIRERQAEEISNTNAQLEKKNEELEQKNQELDQQIKETKKQTELAILEKQNAQERQLFRTLSYAQQVLDNGDRLQAAAILTQAYEKFPQDSDLFDEFKSKLEATMAETAYYPEFSTYTILEQSGSIDHIAFSKDSALVAAASEKSVTIWDIETVKKTLELEHDSPVSYSLFLNDLLISGTTDGYIYVWDLQSGDLRQKLDNDHIREISNNKKAHWDECIEKIAYNEALNAVVYTYQCDGYPSSTCVTICPFEAAKTGEVLASGQTIYSDSPIALSDNGRYAAVGAAVTDYPYDNADIYCYDLNRFDLQKTVNDNMDANGIKLEHFDQRIYSYSIKNDGTLYINAKNGQGSGSLVYIYDITSDSFLLPMTEAYDRYDGSSVTIGYFEDVFFPNEYSGSMIYASDTQIHFIGQEDDRYVTEETFYAADYHSTYSTNQEATAIYAPNDEYALLIFNANSDFVCVYDPETETCKELQKPTGNLLSMAITDDGNFFAVGTDAGTVMLYRKDANGVPAEQISVSLERRNAFSSTGLVLTQGGGNGEPTDVSVYDINANADIAKLQMTTDDSCITDEDFVFNAEGTFVLGSEYSYSDDKTYLRIWDPRTGAVVNRLESINSKITNHTDLVTYHLGETSQYIATVIRDTLYVYDLLSDEFVFEEPYENSGSIQIFIHDTQGIIRIVDLIGGTITEINMESGISKRLGYINYYGSDIAVKCMDFEHDRLFLQQYIGLDSNEFCVYSISEMKQLFNITEINLCSGPFWSVTREGTSTVAGGWYADGRPNLFQIPDFEEIAAQTKQLAENRVLTDEERRSCMLDIFD